MTDGIKFDFSEVNQLAADLSDAGLKVVPFVKKAVEVTARNIKDDAQAFSSAASGIHARAYPHSIDYDMKLIDGAIGAEIGPNMGKNQGQLGFLEEAHGGVRAKPQFALRRAAKKNEADFIKGITQAGKDALK